MRNHLEILKEIDTILLNKEMLLERQELENEIRASSTGGELYSRVGSKLLTLKRQNTDLDASVGHLIKEFISYGKSIGIYPKEVQILNGNKTVFVKLLISTFYSIVAFCVISYLSIMASLLSTVGDPSSKPVTNVGFPLKYYYQFWVSSSDSPNCGWQLEYFVIDSFIIWASTLTVYFLFKTPTIRRF